MKSLSFNIKYAKEYCSGIEIYYVYRLNVNTFYMRKQQGFYPFYFVFLQMKNENISFKVIVERLKLVPTDILNEWNEKFETEHPQIDPEHYLYVELPPRTDNTCRYQPYHFENTLDALRFELDELLYEKSRGMLCDSATGDDETFLIMLEDTNSICHRYLTDITITPVGENNYWISFSLIESNERIIKRAKKAIKFYMKWIFTRRNLTAFSWN
ncbi:hypothetical protein SAMN05661012_03289 [Chitinophaga sancti]|uniref:Uncharacterized protein n=2 Tax=Chitinophaga sancti TaxID=1004 RepID=A0A1K1R2R9_9BACT|nr:hypothetical protein SAMN05661012_03289 [Chitinophaga sancti]